MAVLTVNENCIFLMFILLLRASAMYFSIKTARGVSLATLAISDTQHLIRLFIFLVTYLDRVVVSKYVMPGECARQQGDATKNIPDFQTRQHTNVNRHR